MDLAEPYMNRDGAGLDEDWQEFISVVQKTGISVNKLAKQIEGFYRNKIPEEEHYYSHKGKLGAGHADLHFCECGKYDKDRDRLLRHIRWHELHLTAQFNSKGE